MAIIQLARDDSALGTWWFDYDDVGLTVGHTCTTTAPGARLVLTIVRVTTFKGGWSAAAIYAQGDDVTGSDGRNYVSLANNNLNHDPVTDGGVRWRSTTRDVTADFGQGRIVDITNVQPSEVPVHVKGTSYPFTFSGSWTPPAP